MDHRSARHKNLEYGRRPRQSRQQQHLFLIHPPFQHENETEHTKAVAIPTTTTSRQRFPKTGQRKNTRHHRHRHRHRHRKGRRVIVTPKRRLLGESRRRLWKQRNGSSNNNNNNNPVWHHRHRHEASPTGLLPERGVPGRRYLPRSTMRMVVALFRTRNSPKSTSSIDRRRRSLLTVITKDWQGGLLHESPILPPLHPKIWTPPTLLEFRNENERRRWAAKESQEHRQLLVLLVLVLVLLTTVPRIALASRPEHQK